MDVRERWSDLSEAINAAMDGLRQSIFTAIPVKLAKDADGHVASLQPTIKAVRLKPDGTVDNVSFPQIEDAPIQFPSGGGITHTVPLKEGDEGMAIIASRPVDTWHQSGGEQPQIDARMHDLSDAHLFPGLRSTPKKLKGYSRDTAQTRTDDKQSLRDFGHYGMTDLRGSSAQRIDDSKIMAQKGGSRQVLDARTVQKTASKILLNC